MEEVTKMYCGQCGNTKHEIYKRKNGEIITECLKCGSQSEIIITQPQIIIRNNKGLGTLTD